MRSLYKLTNSSSSLSVIPASLLRVQFIHLANDALLFLVGVWLTEEDARLRRIALSHAFAFIAAYDSTETIIDFQTVLPALLVALGDPDRGARHHASECVHLISRLSKAKQASGVYAFDAVYEKSTSKVWIVVMILGALRGYNRSAQVPQLGRLSEIHGGDSDISRALRSRF
jgi:U3 small nucleolar RNA-associated protein 10